jgi:hypothetical protein
VLDPVYIPNAVGEATREDFLEAAQNFFARFNGRKIGVQLSGGFDSSLIIGLLRYFGIPHGLVGLESCRYEFRTERTIQHRLAEQNGDVLLIDEATCLPCSRLRAISPHQVPDLLSLDLAQDHCMACNRLGIDVLLSGGGGDNLLGAAVPTDAADSIWRPQTFTDSFPVDIVYRPMGIDFLSFFGESGIVDACFRLRRGQDNDPCKRWAREFFRDFVPQELADYTYCADFWGRSIDGLLCALGPAREIHAEARVLTGNTYFDEEHLERLLAEDLHRPRKELYQRIEARISSAVWVVSLAKWIGISEPTRTPPVEESHT